jgi:hypothetical protein
MPSRVIAAALGLLALGATEAPQAPTEPTVLIVQFQRPPKYVGQPKCCPGSDCSVEPAEEEICTAVLQQGKTDVMRHMSGPRLPRKILLRMAMGHSMVGMWGRPLLVVAVPFEDQGTTGYFALWWSGPKPDGRFCEREDIVMGWQEGPLRRHFLAAKPKRFKERGDDAAFDWRCISA